MRCRIARIEAFRAGSRFTDRVVGRDRHLDRDPPNQIATPPHVQHLVQLRTLQITENNNIVIRFVIYVILQVRGKVHECFMFVTVLGVTPADEGQKATDRTILNRM